MQTSTSVTRQIPYEREVVGPRPLTTAQAIDLLYLMALLKRWDRVLEACGGDREHALRVWREVGRAELADAERRSS
jgi:hypothetical protein